MTALRERVIAFLETPGADLKSWKEIFDELNMPEPTYIIFKSCLESTLRAIVEEMVREATKRTITDVEGDWDRGYNMAVQEIAQAILEKGGAS